MQEDAKRATGPVVIDPRQPRLGQAITGMALLIGFVLAWRPILPVLAAVLGAASLIGPRANIYAHLFRWAKRVLRFGPPKELEEPAPPRFANTVGFVFLSVASVLAFGWEANVAAWTLGLIVSALALLAAVTGLCVGCEIYVVARRLATRGRVSSKLTVPVRRESAAA
jgi:uncharacterized protein DUF4395